MNENNTTSPLFPAIEPFATHMLEVGDGHTLYVEQCGNPNGLPVVVLHGGPGTGCSPSSRRRFDPAVYHIICFDQRGCGRSLALHRLEANTTEYLVADIETIRTTLNLKGVVLYGTSWGSTLALAYAQAYPQHVRGMIIGGIFLGTQAELDWVNLPSGLPQFRWTQYQDLLAVLPNGKLAPERTLEESLLQLITGDDPERAIQAARAYATYECSGFFPEPDMASIRAYVEADPHITAHIAIELFYFANLCFLQADQLLNGCKVLQSTPVILLQGGLDLVCTPKTAHRLHAALPHSTLQIIPSSGHIANAAMEAARVEATTAMAKRFGF
jgi:proline iminopeptidase